MNYEEDKFLRNLVKDAQDGKLDVVIGREDEIIYTMEILCRRIKNNPILIGAPGVGKTAIVEGLAQRIVRKEVPSLLYDCEIFALDIGMLLADAKYMGDFEGRLKRVIQKIESNDKYIMFIDEIHLIIGAGKSGGSLDAANMLKPGLARGTIRCIGATTYNEYKNNIENDPAFSRRFHNIYVSEPSEEEALAILRGIKETYELHHGTRITDKALSTAVYLSQRYINNKYLPDKALDLVDEACSNMRIKIDAEPIDISKKKRLLAFKEMELKAIQKEFKDSRNSKEMLDIKNEINKLKHELEIIQEKWQNEKGLLTQIREIRKEIKNLKTQQHNAQNKGNFDKVAEIIYSMLPKLQNQLKEQIELSKQFGMKDAIDSDEIAAIVARNTGIPVHKMLTKDTEKLLRINHELAKRVIGQEYAINAISRSIIRSRSGLFPSKKPIGVFMCVGPTGVGKTELAKALADYLFDDENAMIRIDMSEFLEEHTIARLIGSPPGYVGYDKGGILTEAVRLQPYQIILLDEIEKAHPRIWNLFLQIFDDGRATDGMGRLVAFQHTIFMMTSNLGSQDINYSSFNQHEIDKIRATVSKVFPVEFVNRLDEIIVFHPLTRENIAKILEIQIKILNDQLEIRNISITIDINLKHFIIKNGYDLKMGARPIQRLFNQMIKDPLSVFIIKNSDFTGNILIELLDNTIVLNKCFAYQYKQNDSEFKKNKLSIFE